MDLPHPPHETTHISKLEPSCQLHRVLGTWDLVLLNIAAIVGLRWLSNSTSVAYNSVYCLTILWAATGLNILGLERANWLQNLGGMATWTAATLVIGAGAVAWHRFGAATPFTAADVMPDMTVILTLLPLLYIFAAFPVLRQRAARPCSARSSRWYRPPRSPIQECSC